MDEKEKQEKRLDFLVEQFKADSREYRNLPTPKDRDSFTFGGGKKEEDGYFITDRCVGCGKCVDAYPQHCIFTGKIPFRIVQEHCLRCGNCRALCPAGAVERRCFHG